MKIVEFRTKYDNYLKKEDFIESLYTVTHDIKGIEELLSKIDVIDTPEDIILHLDTIGIFHTDTTLEEFNSFVDKVINGEIEKSYLVPSQKILDDISNSQDEDYIKNEVLRIYNTTNFINGFDNIHSYRIGDVKSREVVKRVTEFLDRHIHLFSEDTSEV